VLNLFTVMILVCSVDLTPADCQPESAIDEIIGPAASNELLCARDGEAYVATTPLVIPGETYPKILCMRSGTQDAGSEILTAKIKRNHGQKHG
jgi:hypothetical protein